MISQRLDFMTLEVFSKLNVSVMMMRMMMIIIKKLIKIKYHQNHHNNNIMKTFTVELGNRM